MHEAVDFIVFDFLFSKLLGGAYVIKKHTVNSVQCLCLMKSDPVHEVKS